MPADCSAGGPTQEALAKLRGALGRAGKPLLGFSLLQCWAVSGTGTQQPAEVFSSQDFAFKPLGIGLEPKLQKYLENKVKI